jgi:hypothetical protein
MENLAWILTGGFAKGYRTQVLGVTTACRPWLYGRSATCRWPTCSASFPLRSAG